MKNHITKEAYYERLRNLADVNKTSVKESKTRNLGNLIDYKRAADGVAYGIVKESHHYYIKKAGTKPDPNVSDFVYIGGLANITNFQYKSLAEADKQRNMLFHTIIGVNSLKPNKSGSKMVLTEDVAEKEIEIAADKVDDLDAATNAETTPEFPTDNNVENPAPESDEEIPTPEGGEGEEHEKEETSDEEEKEHETGEELSDEETVSGDTEENIDEPNKEIEKTIGKLTNKIRKTEMTDSQVKSYINSFLTSFKDKLTNIEIEDRKKMADKLIKVVQPEDIEDLGDNIPQDDVEEGKICAECGGFAKYAESRGYNAESIKECNEEEVGNLVSGYANAHNDGINDGDLKNVALVIKIVSPDILNSLKNDYGHEDYANKLTPYVESMNESNEEDNITKLNELFGGLGSLGKAAMGGIKSVRQAVGSALKTGAEKVGQAAQNVKQTYYKGEVNPAIKKVETDAANLGKQIANLNNTLTKSGQQPINVKSILSTISNQLGGGAGQANLNKFRTNEAGMSDPANIPVQPNMLKEEDDEKPKTEEDNITPETNDNFSFAPDAQTLGGGFVKPDTTPTTGVDINVDAQNKTVNVAMNESEKKLRKYIRNHLEEMAGIKKTKINENVKSPTLKKLDIIIDKQFKLYENVVVKKKVK